MWGWNSELMIFPIFSKNKKIKFTGNSREIRGELKNAKKSFFFVRVRFTPTRLLLTPDQKNTEFWAFFVSHRKKVTPTKASLSPTSLTAS